MCYESGIACMCLCSGSETNEFVQNAGEKKFVCMTISFNRDVDVECSTDEDKVIFYYYLKHTRTS